MYVIHNIYTTHIIYIREVYMLYPWIRGSIYGHMAFVTNTPDFAQWILCIASVTRQPLVTLVSGGGRGFETRRVHHPPDAVAREPAARVQKR